MPHMPPRRRIPYPRRGSLLPSALLPFLSFHGKIRPSTKLHSFHKTHDFPEALLLRYSPPIHQVSQTVPAEDNGTTYPHHEAPCVRQRKHSTPAFPAHRSIPELPPFPHHTHRAVPEAGLPPKLPPVPEGRRVLPYPL